MNPETVVLERFYQTVNRKRVPFVRVMLQAGEAEGEATCQPDTVGYRNQLIEWARRKQLPVVEHDIAWETVVLAHHKRLQILEGKNQGPAEDPKQKTRDRVA